jgi:hypothetical protein
MAPWDHETPGAWLRSRGASPAAVELMTLGFGANFGSAASFLLHRLNSRGSTASYRIEGGNDRLPAEFARRVAIRYGAAVFAVEAGRSRCGGRGSQRRRPWKRCAAIRAICCPCRVA